MKFAEIESCLPSFYFLHIVGLRAKYLSERLWPTLLGWCRRLQIGSVAGVGAH